MTRFLAKHLVLIFIGAVTSTVAPAHDIWLTVHNDGSGPRVAVNFGHPDSRSAPPAEKLLDLEAITSGGTQSLRKGVASAVIDKNPVIATTPNADAARALLAARYDTGFWVKTPDGYRNSSKLNFPDASDSLWSMKFAKTMGGADAPWDKIVGHELEIVPLANPSTVAAGGTLRVRLLFRGQPLSDVEIERGDGVSTIADKDIPRFKTNSDGIADIPIVKDGPYLLVADYKSAPSRAPALAASDMYGATFAFSTGLPK
jgi:nickel transport protein